MREAQLLLHHNRFGTFNHTVNDDRYDEATAEAVRRAWFWIGAPESSISTRFDEHLFALLSEQRPLPEAWRRRRAGRLNRARRVILWQSALAVAREEVGRQESRGGPHQMPYTAWYGVEGPWSVMFVSFCYAQAGSGAFIPGERYAYAPYVFDDARRGRNDLSIVSEPMVGDIALVGTRERVEPTHAAIVEDPEAEGGCGVIIGGHSRANGLGRVDRIVLPEAEVFAFVHVRG